MLGKPSPKNVSTKLQRIAELARQAPQMAFTGLSHHIDVELLREAYRRTRKDGAPGVDDRTGAEYAQNLEANLQTLLDRFKSGSYRAPAVRRVHIPKGDGKTRPIGIPTFEDKVLQRAVHMVMEAVYEQDFLPCSYGFRPGRSAHQALETLWRELTLMQGGWVLEVDIQGFFDTLDHGHLRSFLDRRIRDGVVRRTIGKWLNAGVLEAGELQRPAEGTPQGGVISPLLANVYLHEVLDVWFETEVKPRLQGRALLVRYADDAVMVFSSERDARRVYEVIKKRFAKYGLTLHPAKTRLVEFSKPRPPGDGGPGPETFDLLGFTHHWGKSRRGALVVKRRTMRGRLRRAIVAMHAWCRKHRHARVSEQQRVLNLKLRGHYQYYGITGNWAQLSKFFRAVKRTWRSWLDRRSRAANMRWRRFNELLIRHPLARPRIVHSTYRPAANL
jgi:group II intron reverse transcriptase/maturase